MSWLAANLSPIVLILVFYALLGAALRLIFAPDWRAGLLPRTWSARPRLRMPDFTARTTRRRVLVLLFAGAGLALTLPIADWLRFLIAQIALLVAVLIAVNVTLDRRLADLERTRLFHALRSPLPDLASDALATARRLGLLQDGSLANQDWRDARWAGANLAGADLTGANLHGADLRQADLSHARLTGANLRDADLSAATFHHADLSRASLAGVRAKSARFHRARLVEADLTAARLQACDFTLADLRGCDLRGANLKQADLSGAALLDLRLDAATRLPKTLAHHLRAGPSLTAGNPDGQQDGEAGSSPAAKEPEQSPPHLR